MLYEFALLPDVYREAITCAYQSDQRDLMNLLDRLMAHSLLVDLRNRELYRHIFDLLTQHDTGYLGDIRELLKILFSRNRIVTHPVSLSATGSDVDWISEAISARDKCGFDGIIISPDSYLTLTNPQNFIIPFPASPSVPTDWSKWQGKRSRRTRKCRSDFESALAPAFRHALRVHLVDPYFNCHRPEYRETLNLCVDLLMDGTASHPELFIHAGDPALDRTHNPESAQNRELAWKSYLNSVSIRRPMTFRVYFWGNVPPERVHNRYIFTDQCVGIKTGDGLDCHNPNNASKDTWGLEDVDVAKDLLADYTSRPIYRRLGSVEVAR